MKRINALFALILTVALLSCGQDTSLQTDSEKGKNTNPNEKIEFPISGKVIGVLRGSSMQVQLETKSGISAIQISENATVFFDKKPVTLKSIAKDQSIYLESADDKTATNIVITDWPGLDKVGNTVSISKQMVTARFLEFIKKNHPELNIPKDEKRWTVVKENEKIGDDDMANVIESGDFKFRMLWMINQTEPEYDAILTKKGNVTAVWSGRFRKDGKIIEERYEKP